MILRELVKEASKLVQSGYYDANYEVARMHNSFASALSLGSGIVCELKLASPSQGDMRVGADPVKLACDLEAAGASALSVVTQPYLFKGSLNSLAQIASKVKIPVLMKDIIVSERQVEAARRCGADAVLIIYRAVEYLGLRKVKKLIDYAHELGLEIVLETHGLQEFNEARILPVEIIGVNNRNLEDLTVDLDVSRRVLKEAKSAMRLILCESGINSPREIRELRRLGANGFLIGTSIMKASDPADKLRELMNA